MSEVTVAPGSEARPDAGAPTAANPDLSTPDSTLVVGPAERDAIAAAFSVVREALRTGRVQEGDVVREARFALDVADGEQARDAFNATAMRFGVSPPVG
jgi:hypothetical protein